MCFGGTADFSSRLAVWRNMLSTTGAELLLADHAPTALLAARQLSIPAATLGTGFCCPPDNSPWPNWRPEAQLPIDKLVRQETLVLDHLNAQLEQCQAEPLERISDVFNWASANLLTTLGELDHFPKRENANYLGVWPSDVGEPTAWPEGASKRVFVYLKPNQGVAAVLQTLNAMPVSTLAYIPGLADPSKKQLAHSSLRFLDIPADLQQMADECDFAVLNAGHGATTTMLLAGKPLLLLPIYLEQLITTRRVEALGAALGANLGDGDQIAAQLKRLLGDDGFQTRAMKFATGYRGYDPHDALRQAIESICSLLPATP